MLFLLFLLLHNNSVNGYSIFDLHRWEESSKDEFPWLVAITTSSEEIVCNGAFIDDNWILTAAHCFDSKEYSQSSLQVVAGNKYNGTEQVRNIHGIVIHPSYESENTTEGDIALVEFSSSLKMIEGCVEKIKIPSASIGNYTELSAFSAGWGVTSKLKDRPRKNYFKILPLNDPMQNAFQEPMNDSIYYGRCSGAPLLCVDKNGEDDLYICGVISEYSEHIYNEQELKPQKVFTNLLPYMDWMVSVVKQRAMDRVYNRIDNIYDINRNSSSGLLNLDFSKTTQIITLAILTVLFRGCGDFYICE